MKKEILGLISMIAVTSANAHELNELTVSKFEVKHNFVFAYLDGTVKGKSITCAAYGEGDVLLVSGQWVTANLATAAQILYDGNESKVKSVRCAYN